MGKLILTAAMALATSAALAVTASAQIPDRSSTPVLSVRQAPSFKPPIVTRRLTLRAPAPELSPARLSASARAVQREPRNRALLEPDVARRWPFRADPRRWPRLFANTTECSLSFDPILRRHWFD
jgi:hypothetical protein